jgi:hypothetical protein
MYRRRYRRPREIAFSLDSFLDVVANVVGIIIRLILVAWVGARSYKALTQLPPTDPPAAAAIPIPADPLEHELDQQREELRQTQERLLEQMRRLQDLQAGNAKSDKETLVLSAQLQELEKERGAIDSALKQKGWTAAAAVQSLEDLRKRRERLEEDLRALEKMPSAKKTLRYHTPVSRPVHLEELHFECINGRVTFVDVAAFLLETRGEMQECSALLRHQWLVEKVTSPVGPFRMRYSIERERGLLDSSGPPDPHGAFRYSLSGWTIEPLTPDRGETLEAALAPSSAFRQIVDAIDPEQSVITFWVCTDSFPLFRKLRDYLYERNVEVAGRPLPRGYPIASSRGGTVSRGQ